MSSLWLTADVMEALYKRVAHLEWETNHWQRVAEERKEFQKTLSDRLDVVYSAVELALDGKSSNETHEEALNRIWDILARVR